MSATLLILAMAAVTYAPRLAGLLWHGHVPPFWERALRFVPISVFAALVVPALPGERGEGLVRCLAAAAAALAAWRTRTLWVGLAVGMAGYWALR